MTLEKQKLMENVPMTWHNLMNYELYDLSREKLLLNCDFLNEQMTLGLEKFPSFSSRWFSAKPDGQLSPNMKVGISL